MHIITDVLRSNNMLTRRNYQVTIRDEVTLNTIKVRYIKCIINLHPFMGNMRIQQILILYR